MSLRKHKSVSLSHKKTVIDFAVSAEWLKVTLHNREVNRCENTRAFLSSLFLEQAY